MLRLVTADGLGDLRRWEIYGHFIPQGDRRAVDALDMVGGQDARKRPQPGRNHARVVGDESLMATGG